MSNKLSQESINELRQQLYQKDVEISDFKYNIKQLETTIAENKKNIAIQELQTEIQQFPNKLKKEMELTVKQLNQLETDHQMLDMQFQIQMKKADQMKSEFQKTIHSLKLLLTEKEKSENEKIQQIEKLKKDNFTEILEKKKALTTIEAKDRDHKLINSQMNDKIQMLESEIQRMKENEIQFLTIRDAEAKKMNDYFMQRIQKQCKEYEEIIQQQQKQLNYQRELVEEKEKDKLLLEDQMRKQDMLYKDWQKSYDRLGKEKQLLDQQIIELQNQIDSMTNERNQKAAEGSRNKYVDQLILKFRSITIEKQSSQTKLEQMKTERDNMEIELKNTLEQMQSQFTFEKFKLTEQFQSLQKRLEETKLRLQSTIEDYEQKISQLVSNNSELQKKADDCIIEFNSLQQKYDLLVTNFQKEQQKLKDQLIREHTIDIKKIQFIFYLRELLAKTNFNKQIKYQEQTIRTEVSKNRYFDQKRVTSLDDVLKALDRFNDDQLEVIKERFKADIWDQLKIKQREKEQVFESKISQLQLDNQKCSIELAKVSQQYQQYKILNETLQQQISQLNTQIATITKNLADEAKYHEEQRKFDIQQLKKWFTSSIKDKDAYIKTLHYKNQEQVDAIKRLSDDNMKLVDTLQNYQSRLIEGLKITQADAIKSVHEIFEQQANYIRILMDQIHVLKQKNTNSFHWRGNNKLDQDIDKVRQKILYIVKQFFSFYIVSKFNRSQRQTPKSNNRSLSIQETNKTDRIKLMKTEGPQQSPNKQMYMSDLEEQVKRYLEGTQLTERIENKLKNQNQTGSLFQQDIEQEKMKFDQMRNKVKLKLTQKQDYQIQAKQFAPLGNSPKIAASRAKCKPFHKRVKTQIE